MAETAQTTYHVCAQRMLTALILPVSRYCTDLHLRRASFHDAATGIDVRTNVLLPSTAGQLLSLPDSCSCSSPSPSSSSPSSTSPRSSSSGPSKYLTSSCPPARSSSPSVSTFASSAALSLMSAKSPRGSPSVEALRAALQREAWCLQKPEHVSLESRKAE